MQLDENEEKLLRSVALQNAQAVLRARDRSEKQLLAANQRITSILESITDGFVAFDPEWNIIYINPRAKALVRPLHSSGESLVGRNHWEAFPESLGTPIEENYRRAMREQVTVQFEVFYPPLNSWFDIRAYPSPHGLSVYFQDVTERRHSADSLREQREWLAVTLRSIGDGVVATDKQSRITFLNPVAESMTGWKSEEALGKPLAEVFHLIHEQSRAPAEAPITEVLREERVVELANHTSLISRDGTERAIEDSAAPIRDSAGNVTGAVMVFHDVTERRRAESALRQSEERWRGIFNHAAVGVAVASLEGKFQQVNQKFGEILGYAPDELRNVSVVELTHPEDRPPTRVQMGRLLTGEIPHYVMEKRYTRKDGSVVWSLTTVTLVRDQASAPSHFIGIIEDITPRKQAESEVRLGRERLELALAAGGLGDWEWDAATDLVTLSEKARSIFGVAGSTIRWAEMRELLHKNDRERARLAVEKTLANRSEYDIEYRVMRPGGEYAWVLARGRGRYSEDGAVLGMRGVVADITSRKRAEEMFFRLAAVVESSDDAILSMDLEGTLITWNKGAQQIFGYTADEVIGKSITILIPPNRENEEPAILARLKRGERVEHYETIRRRKDGTLLHVSLSVSPIRDSQGEIIGVSKISRDITPRKEAESALREQAQTLEMLNETGMAIAAQLDLDKLVQIITDAATKLCGARFGAFFYNVIDEKGESLLLYSLSGAPREAFEKFGHPRATPLFGPTFRGEGVIRLDDVLKDERYGKMPPHHGMPQGHLPVRSYLAVPVKSRRGEVIGGLFFGHPEPGVFTARSEGIISGVAAQAAVAIDNARLYEAAQREIAARKRLVDELHQAQAELSHHAEHLEEEVAARTASLTEAISQLEEFSYSVSHDLRAPLRAISGYNRILEADFGNLLPPEAHVFLQKIARSSERMERLVNDVLTMTRVARVDLKLHRISLQTFITEIMEQHPTMQAPKAAVSVDTPHAVNADAAALDQVLSNLLSNAVKFVTPAAKPVVRVYSERVGDRVRIWVEDQGVGIPPQHRSKLFGMFQRLPGSLHYEGTGIGLAIVRKAVERMGGKVGMEPNQPSGSRFWIELNEAP